MARAGILLFALAACTDGAAPPPLAELGAGVGADMAPGGACTSVCDCPSGLGCVSGKCETTQAQTYCCNSPMCMGTAACEFPDGTISQCDRADAGGIAPSDGGTPSSACAMISCSQGSGGNLFCRLACGNSSATCVNSGGIEHCMP